MASRFTSGQIRLLIVLMLVNFVNYIDRQVIFPLFPLIRAEFSLTYFQVGMLASAFSLVHSLSTLPLRVLADRTSRRKVISYGVLFWSGATFLSGIARSFHWLLAIRSLVGLGEAAYTPAATAMITGAFPRGIRARVQGVYDLGMFVGGAAGLALGGILAEWLGWRPAFFVVGVPGLLLGLTVFRLPETPRASESVERIPIFRLLRVPAYLMVLIGGWFITFAAHVYITWGAEFVHESKGFSLREAGVSLGVTVTLAGVLGLMAGAALADRLTRRWPWGRILTVCIGFLASAPLILTALHARGKVVLLGTFFLGVFFMTWYHGPVTATMHDLIPARAHSTAVGLYYFFVNFFATTLAPGVVGRIADAYGLLAGMHTAVIAQAAGALCFLGVVYFVRRDGLRHPAVALYDEPAQIPAIRR